jgi:hypothetical protein
MTIIRRDAGGAYPGGLLVGSPGGPGFGRPTSAAGTGRSSIASGGQIRSGGQEGRHARKDSKHPS